MNYRECPSCGYPYVPEDSDDCPECGSVMPAPAGCPFCGAPRYEGEIYCYSCGYRLSAYPQRIREDEE